jgi:Uma2 family endonuclease
MHLPQSFVENGAVFASRTRITPDEFWDICVANPDVRMELTAKGEIVVAPPAGWTSGVRDLEASGSLRAWAKRNKKGVVGGPTSSINLPSGAVLTPDASWISHTRLAHVTDEQRQRFLPAVPEFVIEVLSPSDSRRQALAKMRDWILEGVDLAWLIDPPKKTVYVFRRGQAEPERIVDANSIQGEGPLATFKLDLRPIWKGRA